MNLDYWGSLRPTVKIKRDRSRITIPAFSAACAEQGNRCVEISGNNGLRANDLTIHISTIDNPFLSGAWQVDLWVRPLEYVDGQDIRMYSYGSAGTTDEDQLLIMVISEIDHKFKVNIKNNALASSTFVVDVPLELGVWHHVGVSYDNVTNPGTPIVKVFANGIQVNYTDAALATLRAFGGTAKQYIGSPRTDGKTITAPFQLDEVRIWACADVLMPDWYFFGNAPKAARFLETSDGVDTGGLYALSEWPYLFAYYKFNESASPYNSTNPESPAFSTVIGSSAFILNQSTGYPNAWSAASHISAQIPLASIAKNFSIKYPLARPDDATFSLTVAWIDDNGDVQRRTLWETGLSYPASLPYEAYHGEKINYATAYLECWNDYGYPTVDLVADYTFDISPIVSPMDELGTRPAATSISAASNIYATADLAAGESFDQNPAS